MDSEERSQGEFDQDELNKNMILEIFYNTKGGLDEVNAAIDKKLFGPKVRSITLFEKFITARFSLNPKSLSLSNKEITSWEAAYLSKYPGLENVEQLDLRKNKLGDEGLEVLLASEKIRNIRVLDLRNNQITRKGMMLLANTENLLNLESLDLRVNKLGKRWEEKLKEQGNFPKLTLLRIA